MKRTNPLALAKQRAPYAVAFVCEALMLLAVPLVFHDAFFDINRCKVNMVCRVVPVLAVLYILSLLLRGRTGRAARTAVEREAKAPVVLMAAFLLACVVACAFAGFEEAVLTGSEGRYCGLYFLLSCGAAFFIVATSALDGRLLSILAMLCASAIAALGFANSMGIDPLGFYVRIRQYQRSAFLSTIGHINFFGTYLSLMLPLAGGFYVFGRRAPMRLFAAVCAGVIAFGISAPGTDSAFLSMHLSCLMLLALSGGNWARMSRTLMLWGLCFLSLPIACKVLEGSFYHPEINGLLLLLCDHHIALLAALALTLAGCLCALFLRLGRKPPSRKALLIAVGMALLVGALLLIGGMVVFTVVAPEADIGQAAAFLRLNDQWGTLRGAVYRRAARAYADYSLREKLFGRGLDLALRILEPYFDDPAILVGGVFNDAHCQPLQLLLTCGLFGCAAFVALYLSVLVLLFRRAGDDPLLCGALAALCGYLPTMLLNVTQPILISTYLAVAALAVAKVNASALAERGIRP